MQENITKNTVAVERKSPLAVEKSVNNHKYNIAIYVASYELL